MEERFQRKWRRSGKEVATKGQVLMGGCLRSKLLKQAVPLSPLSPLLRHHDRDPVRGVGHSAGSMHHALGRLAYMKTLVAFGILCLASANVPAKDLYVVVATSPAYVGKFGSSILKVTDSATTVAAIFPPEDGILMMLINPQDRWLAGISFMPRPRKLALIQFDQPDKVNGFVLSERTFSAYFIRDPTMGLRLAAIRGGMDRSGWQSEVVRFQLSGGAEPSLADANPPGQDDFKYAEVTGTSGLASLGYTDQFVARVDPDNKTAILEGKIQSDFTLPPSLVANNQGLNLFIRVMNREVVALHEASILRGVWVRDPDCVWYLNRSSKQWHKLSVAGEPEIRGFGHWFAVTERLTTKRVKQERRAQRPHSRSGRMTGPNMDHVFNNFESDGKPWNYTGTFRILDGSSDNEREWILETGNENSEVLLIEDDRTMIYRIEDSLWQANLDVSGKITGAKRLCTDPRLLDAHWAFFSDWVAR
jgi:hypothetical protein